MAWPTREIIDRVAPHVPGALVAPDALGRIRSLGAQMPTGWSSYYIECRLAPGADQTDLLGGVGFADGGVLHQALSSALTNQTLAHAPLWQRFANLCASWREGGSTLGAQVPALWVELDHAESAAPSTIAPSFCVCVARDYLCPSAFAPDGHGAQSALGQSLRLLLPEGMDPDTGERLDRVLRAGVTHARVIHLSVMLGRSPAAIKLYLEVARDQVAPLGKALHCTTAFEEVSALARDLAPDLQTVYLDLTVSAAIDQRIGVAFSQFHLRDSRQLTPTWAPLLDRLVQRGACSPGKRAALATWPGRDLVHFEGEQWPTHLARFLDVKVVVERSHALVAKAYLGFMPKAALL